MDDSNNPKNWLEIAEKEFDYARSDLENIDQDFFAPTCFHFQQAAEKYLKSYLLAQFGEFRKIHNLVELLHVCAKRDKTFLSLKEDAAILNPFYTDTRYPVHWPIDFTRQDAQKAKNAAENIRNFVKDKLKLQSPVKQARLR